MKGENGRTPRQVLRPCYLLLTVTSSPARALSSFIYTARVYIPSAIYVAHKIVIRDYLKPDIPSPAFDGLSVAFHGSAFHQLEASMGIPLHWCSNGVRGAAAYHSLFHAQKDYRQQGETNVSFPQEPQAAGMEGDRIVFHRV